MTMIEVWRWFREFDKKGLLMHRVDGEFGITRGGYRFDRRIFRSYIIVVYLFIIYILLTSDVGWKETYIACPIGSNGPCENPCYHGGDRCGNFQFQEFLQPGEQFGTPPSEEFSRDIDILFVIIFIGLLFSFVLNHKLHNKGRSVNTIFEEDEV